MIIDRRDFFRVAGTLTAGAVLPLACRTPVPSVSPPPFVHGVASGDPLTDRVILWTRVSAPAGVRQVPVRWEVAEDPGFGTVVARGWGMTGARQDFTVKVDVTGLSPGRTYYYRFDALGQSSPIGRTRTLPVGSLERLRLAVCSCANYPQGFFNAYAHIAQRADLDAVLHLGDYLYEYGRDGYGGNAGLGRDVEPVHETVTLSDYRERHALYKSDPDLQAAHQQHPFIAVWDDHESANDSWMHGAQNHDPATEGAWLNRKAAAIRAYHEWMPIRTLPGDLSGGRIYRAFRFGNLADLVMLDTRLGGREKQGDRDDPRALEDPNRRLLDATQEAWLQAQLDNSMEAGTRWRLLGQQILMGSMSGQGQPVNPDSWDGYPGSRKRLLGHLSQAEIRDVVVLSGDVHSSWAMEVAQNPFSEEAYDPNTGRGSLAVEFVAPAVSSSPLGTFPGAESLLALDSRRPHIRWVDVHARGYTILDLDETRAQAEWYFLDTVERRGAGERFAAAFASAHGENRLLPVSSPSQQRVAAPALAPVG
ncbi:alkaline phosphatase D family protein [Myxococcota bacterium]|nr:alkaline phosphatase D family protein [Myxococcota bacterium]